eukprot:TRINITY_DN5286_c0_g1_i6.p2 TRINITY_DN5286_c0_g1~~TRINITY_DN5286_c0_g1_i6.p2  ORF type:complete len:194 (+),score=18.55 TRINITY_DN5286_c0_g1_i6:495-1076(+)
MKNIVLPLIAIQSDTNHWAYEKEDLCLDKQWFKIFQVQLQPRHSLKQVNNLNYLSSTSRSGQLNGIVKNRINLTNQLLVKWNYYKKDIERYSKKQALNISTDDTLQTQQQQEEYQMAKILEKILIADFFVVVGIMLWLGVAIVAKTQLKQDQLWENWIGLWPTVFQPALGVLMLGSIVQGVIGYVSEKSAGKQ